MAKDVQTSAPVPEKEKTLPAVTSKAFAPPAKDVVVGEMADQFASMEGAGRENVRVGQDTIISRLAILQSLSPQLKKNKTEYIEGAQVGDFCDVGMRRTLPKPLLYIPLYFMTQYLEWKPERKGLAGIHGIEILEKCKVDEKRRYTLDNGNMVAETAQFFGLNVLDDYRLTFIGMTSTQLKKAKFWNTLIDDQKAFRPDGSPFKPPMFWRSYILGTESETNDQGDWEGWKIEAGPRVDPKFGEMDAEAAAHIFRLASEMYKAVASGRAKADLASMQDENTVQGTSSRM